MPAPPASRPTEALAIADAITKRLNAASDFPVVTLGKMLTCELHKLLGSRRGFVLQECLVHERTEVGSRCVERAEKLTLHSIYATPPLRFEIQCASTLNTWPAVRSAARLHSPARHAWLHFELTKVFVTHTDCLLRVLDTPLLGGLVLAEGR